LLILRDLEGCTAEDACTLLGITTENRRVPLHRTRGRFHAMVDALVGDSPAPSSQPASLTWRGPHASLLSRWIDDALCGLSAFMRECLWTGGTA